MSIRCSTSFNAIRNFQIYFSVSKQIQPSIIILLVFNVCCIHASTGQRGSSLIDECKSERLLQLFSSTETICFHWLNECPSYFFAGVQIGFYIYGSSTNINGMVYWPRSRKLYLIELLCKALWSLWLEQTTEMLLLLLNEVLTAIVSCSSLSLAVNKPNTRLFYSIYTWVENSEK